MIEDALIQYGVLGLWTTTLIAEKLVTHKKMMDIMTEVRELLIINNKMNDERNK